MPHFSHTVRDEIAVLTMNSGENRFNPEFLAEISTVMDAIEASDARVLVVTSAHPRVFSNGIDLDWVLPVLRKRDVEAFHAYLTLMRTLMRRLTLFPMPTIAAVNGHAFAGGAVLACCFDFRFMQTGHGYFCLPEVDLGVPFLPGMIAVLKKAMPLAVLEELQYAGTRLKAEECAARGIVHTACTPDELLERAMAFAMSLRKRRDVIAEMKRVMHAEVIRAIDVEDMEKIEAGWHEWFMNVPV